jgi:arylsulfatase A-like enzyme
MRQADRAALARPSTGDILFLAIALGLAAGLVHSGVVSWTRHVSEKFTWTSRDLVWMSPLANVCFLLLAATPLALLAARRRIGWTVAASVLGFLAFVSVLLHFSRLHWVALLMVSAGLAVQGARLVARVPARSVRVARLSSAALAVLTLVLGVRERLTRGDTTEVAGAAPDGAPNVLVLILDTVRAKSLSLYGYARATTPHLDTLAGDGVVFDRAIAPSSWTLPSHASMFTGHPAGKLSASWRTPFDGAVPTVASVFRRHGYATGAFVANFFYTHHESGLATGFEEFRDFKVSFRQMIWSSTFGQTPFFNRLLWARTPGALVNAFRSFDLRIAAEPRSDRKRTGEVVQEFLDWRGRERDRPFFAFLNVYDAHDPYDPPREWHTRFATEPTPLDLYDAGIAYMDAALDELFAALRQRGELDRTLIVITSDHGEQFGEHELKNHGNSLYMPVTHVPLLVRYPKAFPGPKRVASAVSLRDVAATLLDVAGLTDAAIPGTSLREACCGSAYRSLVLAETEKLDGSKKDHVPASWGPLASIVMDSLHFIRNGNGTFELYDLKADAGETRNLATSISWCDVAATLDERLRAEAREPATPAFDVVRCRTGAGRDSLVGSAR